MSWKINETFQKEKIADFGNKFLLANGYMGYRGTMEEYGKEELVANTILGLYDQVGEKWREPVNAPNGLYLKLSSAEGLLSLLTKEPLSHEQALDIKNGVHHRKTTFQVGDTQVTIEAKRFVSLDQIHLLADQIRIYAEQPITLTANFSIDTDVWDINGPHLENTQSARQDEVLIVTADTQEQKKQLAVGQLVSIFGETESVSSTSESTNIEFTVGQAGIVFEILAATYNQNDVEEPVPAVVNELIGSKQKGFDKLLANHSAYWQKLWDKADVIIEGDDEAQLALRYSLYQLLSIAPRHSDKVSIPARGLSGQTYKGAVFWDTEMFMLPFFMHVYPEVARNLLMYRVNTLTGALAKAKEYGFGGAFYAWESQEYGQDATSDYNVTDVFTKRPMRTYFRDKQIHISGDIAYAMWEYYQYTKDLDFLTEGAARVIFECAKFYLSYSFYKNEKKRFELIDVIGPDEYHERVYNNAYTNKIAGKTVETALAVWDLLEREAPELLEETLRVCQLSERYPFEAFHKQLYVPQPDEKSAIIEQFDGYFALEDVQVAEVRSRLLNPQEYWGGAYGVASDTQVIKQADVIFMLYLFGDEYSQEVLRKNWEYYEPRTEHGSSLSPCIYALVSCQFGNQDWGYPYFMKTATVDLTGESKQFAGTIYIGGTHPAANGGAWMAAVLGFAGLAVKDNELTVTPRLPKKWRKLSFKTIYQGISYQVTVTQDEAKIIPLVTQ